MKTNRFQVKAVCAHLFQKENWKTSLKKIFWIPLSWFQLPVLICIFFAVGWHGLPAVSLGWGQAGGRRVGVPLPSLCRGDPLQRSTNSASHRSATSSSSSSRVTPNFNSGLVSVEIQFLQQWSNCVILPLHLYVYFIFLEMCWSELELAAAPGAGAAGDAARCPLTSGMFAVESSLWLACSQQMGSLCCSCLRAAAFSCS